VSGISFVRSATPPEFRVNFESLPAQYGVSSYQYRIANLAPTTPHAIIGTMSLMSASSECARSEAASLAKIPEDPAPRRTIGNKVADSHFAGNAQLVRGWTAARTSSSAHARTSAQSSAEPPSISGEMPAVLPFRNNGERSARPKTRLQARHGHKSETGSEGSGLSVPSERASGLRPSPPTCDT
jgi:hypothetical protein